MMKVINIGVIGVAIGLVVGFACGRSLSRSTEDSPKVGLSAAPETARTRTESILKGVHQEMWFNEATFEEGVGWIVARTKDASGKPQVGISIQPNGYSTNRISIHVADISLYDALTHCCGVTDNEFEILNSGTIVVRHKK